MMANLNFRSGKLNMVAKKKLLTNFKELSIKLFYEDVICS